MTTLTAVEPRSRSVRAEGLKNSADITDSAKQRNDIGFHQVGVGGVGGALILHMWFGDIELTSFSTTATVSDSRQNLSYRILAGLILDSFY